jgi:hypothetical protein
VGVDKPLFVSPTSKTYMTAAAWSPTRPAVLLVAQADGEIMAWDFTDSSYRPSIELKATPARITSLEFMSTTMSARHQLLAVGVDIGTLHVYELPRNLARPVANEEQVMRRFLEGEMTTMGYLKEYQPAEEIDVDHMQMLANRPETADNDYDNDGDDEAKVDPEQALRDAEQKEMDEFDKLEEAFIRELQLTEVPAFAQKHVDAMLANPDVEDQ